MIHQLAVFIKSSTARSNHRWDSDQGVFLVADDADVFTQVPDFLQSKAVDGLFPLRGNIVFLFLGKNPGVNAKKADQQEE